MINRICFKIIPQGGCAGEVGRSRYKAKMVTYYLLKLADEYLKVHEAILYTFAYIWHFPFKKIYF